ncbi:MAG TPA: hypothetical protein VL371_07985 [Gemmataceae bacterium]|nr:hypothetical protein [Gemmataceae bacterium]
MNQRTRHYRNHRRRGMTAVLAMLFMVLAATLAVGMFAMATMNTQSGRSLSDADRARGLAESGLRWMSWRFMMMNRPKTTIGAISPTVADSLWPAIRTSINSDLANMVNLSERATTFDGVTFKTAPITSDETPGRFVIAIRQHPIWAGDPLDKRYLRVTSTGTFGTATRTLAMDFLIDKKVKFAVIGKVEIQLGKNTLVEGDVAMGTPNKFPPFISLSDFKHLNASLDTQVASFESWLKANHVGYDGRVSVQNPTEWANAKKAGYTDANGDGYIDEYDLFLQQYDASRDLAIAKPEFTNGATGQLYDPALFAAIDSLGGPLKPTDSPRPGYQDGKLDNTDSYVKIRGQVLLADTAATWQSNLQPSGMTIADMFAGPIVPPAGSPAVEFGVSPNQLFDLSPSNFDTSTFANRTGTNAGATSKTATVIQNAVLSPTDANGGTANEQTPYGSSTWQATYKRPVFKNMTFVNCQIPVGMNALFQNCTFQGTTFVHMTTNITNSSGQTTTDKNDGMTWSQRMKSGSFSNTTVLTATNSYGFSQGNNLRFDNCTMNGPIASDVPTAYTHFTNSWEFTGATMFNNTADQTATIVAPQTNIEMGSFLDPAAAPSTLVGVVVAGNIDIRGNTLIDGSVIVTGDGAGNTTLGWFGNNDANTDPNAVPTDGTGWGKLNLRYNPYRALPDGINIAIDILPQPGSYAEAVQ